MTTPWGTRAPLGADAYARMRRRAIFECCKWDPQVEDTATLAPYPLVLPREVWVELAMLAEELARETLEAEAELIDRPELHGILGLPRGCRRALRRADVPSRGAARLIRFDFHHTPHGWRISEANTDVPGGLNEASGVAAIMAEHYDGLALPGDVAGTYAKALLDRSDTGCVALVHATAYTDDRQVMSYLARRLEMLGGTSVLASPMHVTWRARHATVLTASATDRPDVIARFYPAEWLCDLPVGCEWQRFFRGCVTPLSNPASALLTQSKRLPLVWDRLRTPMPTWCALLPETRNPRDIRTSESDAWVLKPALGRVGDGVGIRGVTPDKEWRRIARAARWFPRWWIAQRRFEASPLDTGTELTYPCIGVYTIDGRAAGAYGRIARSPLIDWRARDIPVLVSVRDESVATRRSA